MKRMKLSYLATGKAPDLLTHAVMTRMEELAKDITWPGDSPKMAKEEVKWAIDRLLGNSPELKKRLSVTISEPHAALPNKRFVNLIWSYESKMVLLAQITCDLQEGGEG